jgi:hypothetical protein
MNSDLVTIYLIAVSFRITQNQRQYKLLIAQTQRLTNKGIMAGLGVWFSSEHLPSTHEALGSIPSPQKRERDRERERI